MKRITIVLVLFGLLAAPLFAQHSAVIKEVSGKVEVKEAQKAWAPAQVGMTISKGTYISTGFNSSAVLELGPSVLRVRQLTRMQLEELVEKEGTLTTGVNLPIGKVKAEVKSVAGLRNDFKLKGPVSTAAVRGTGFEYDGFSVKVDEGLVMLINMLLQKRGFAAGEDGSTTGYDALANGEGAKTARTAVDISAGRGVIAAGRADDYSGSILIKW